MFVNVAAIGVAIFYQSEVNGQTAWVAHSRAVSKLLSEMQSTLIDADLSVHNMMQDLRNAPADEIMVMVTMLGDGFVMIAMAIAMVAWLLWRREWRIAAAAFLTIFAARLFVPLMKLWLQRPRPAELSGLPEVFSFPSGHTTFATVTLGVFAVLASHGMRSWGKAVVFAGAGIAIIAISYSRIYLGAHWMSDVLGGFLFGAAMIAAFGIAIEAVPPRRIVPVGLAIVALLAFAVAGSRSIRIRHRSESGKFHGLSAGRQAPNSHSQTKASSTEARPTCSTCTQA